MIGASDIKLRIKSYFEENPDLVKQLRYLTHIQVEPCRSIPLSGLNKVNMSSCSLLRPPAYYQCTLEQLDGPYTFERRASSFRLCSYQIMQSHENMPADEDRILRIHKDYLRNLSISIMTCFSIGSGVGPTHTKHPLRVPQRTSFLSYGSRKVVIP